MPSINRYFSARLVQVLHQVPCFSGSVQALKLPLPADGMPNSQQIELHLPEKHCEKFVTVP